MLGMCSNPSASIFCFLHTSKSLHPKKAISTFRTTYDIIIIVTVLSLLLLLLLLLVLLLLYYYYLLDSLYLKKSTNIFKSELFFFVPPAPWELLAKE